jgi:signal transduction histidine kinase
VFTRNLARKPSVERAARGVLRAARDGASHNDWITETIGELRAAGTERCGVWLQSREAEVSVAGRPPAFRGQVWEGSRGSGSGEWTSLSVGLPLPLEILHAGKTAELILPEESHEPIVGPTLGMRHVLWVPVMVREQLRGLVMLAAEQRESLLARILAEEVAGKLALAMEWEEQSRLARERQADLELAARVHRLLAEAADGDAILAELAESCTQGLLPDGVGAVFALIGERRTGLAVAAPAGARGEERLRIVAASGDSAWGHSVERGPLEMFWRQAVETGQMVSAEAGGLPLARDIMRIVAIPMAWEGATHGVLMAGLSRQGNCLESVERLEQRARLAAQVLRQKTWLAERVRTESWRMALLESSEQPVVLLDRGGFLRGMSASAKKILAQKEMGKSTRGESRERRFAELFRPRDWELANRWLQGGRAGARRAAAADLLRMNLQGGTEVACRRMELSSDEFLAVAMEVVDGNARARHKEDVEEELRQTVDWMADGVVLFDEAGGIRAANEHFRQMMGLGAGEAAEVRTFEELLGKVSGHAADPDGFAQNWRALGDSPEQESQEELQMNWPVPRTLERCTRALVGENGRRLGRVEVYRETTVRRTFQSRMVQTEKLASLGQRVSGIVHELSNPLTTILGYAQRLVQRPPDGGGTANREVRGILSEAERAAGILRQLLQLSGEARTVREPLSVNELVDRTVELIRGTLSGGAIRLMVEKEAAVSRVEGDFGQLQQVLLNLLQNAQQAIEQSGKGGTIGVRTASAAGARVRVEVWDDGPGIPGTIQARVFDPFFTTKPPGVGTGLGLAIVLGFVRQHGGTVHVVSPPKGGTRFLVELPAAQPEAVEEPEELDGLRTPSMIGFTSLRRKTEHRPAAEPHTPKVLVVEDEPTVGGLIADVLRDEGMRVDVLQDGHAALERADKENYDLVICDLKMPGMDGQKFFQSLGARRNPLQGHVLFVTGDVVAPRTQEFLERHRLPYVAKPFRVEELSRAVHGML